MIPQAWIRAKNKLWLDQFGTPHEENIRAIAEEIRRQWNTSITFTHQSRVRFDNRLTFIGQADKHLMIHHAGKFKRAKKVAWTYDTVICQPKHSDFKCFWSKLQGFIYGKIE